MKIANVMLATALVVTAFQANAQNSAWESFDVKIEENGQRVDHQLQPRPAASQKWNICVLVPHMKDSIWTAAGYGLIDEAKRLGVRANILQAGGYDNLPKQVNQFDNCLTSGADAIIAAPISEAGLQNQLLKAREKGIPTIIFMNPVENTPVTSKINVDAVMEGYAAGAHLRKALGDAGGKVVAFPGPQGSGWAEQHLEGFKQSLEGSNVEVLGEMFGDTGVAVQLGLVENALQAYPEMTALWGTAPTVEAALSVIADAGREDLVIMGEYQNQAMYDALKSDQILGFPTLYPPMQGRIAMNLAVSALEGDSIQNNYIIIPEMLTKEGLDAFQLDQIFAPISWQPVFSVE